MNMTVENPSRISIKGTLVVAISFLCLIFSVYIWHLIAINKKTEKLATLLNVRTTLMIYAEKNSRFPESLSALNSIPHIPQDLFDASNYKYFVSQKPYTKKESIMLFKEIKSSSYGFGKPGKFVVYTGSVRFEYD